MQVPIVLVALGVLAVLLTACGANATPRQTLFYPTMTVPAMLPTATVEAHDVVTAVIIGGDNQPPADNQAQGATPTLVPKIAVAPSPTQNAAAPASKGALPTALSGRPTTTPVPPPTATPDSSSASGVDPMLTPTAPVPPAPPSLSFVPPANEVAALARFNSNYAALNDSLKRVDDLMTALIPGSARWQGKLQTEYAFWRDLMRYYKTVPQPAVIGTQVMPLWLAALAHLQQASTTLLPAYLNADGSGVSQADQQIAYAQIELAKIGNILPTLSAP